MPSEKKRLRRVINRRLTDEERQRMLQIREEIEREKPQLIHDAKIELAERVIREMKSKQRIDTVFTPDESHIIDAVDAYAEEHDLSGRAAVVRVALAKLLDIEIDVPHHGWRPGRKRAPV